MTDEAPSLPWVRLNAATFQDARLIRAGFWGGIVWVAALTMAKLHGWRGGLIPKDEFDAPIIGHHVNAVTDETVTQNINAAIMKLVHVGLLEDDGTHWQIRNWAKYQADRTGAERQQRSRDKNRRTPRVTVPSRSNDDGTGRDGTGQDISPPPPGNGGGPSAAPPNGSDEGSNGKMPPRILVPADRAVLVMLDKKLGEATNYGTSGTNRSDLFRRVRQAKRDLEQGSGDPDAIVRIIDEASAHYPDEVLDIRRSFTMAEKARAAS